MTQRELDREIARATGESVAEIRHKGFVPLMQEPYETEWEPLTVDWDESDAERYAQLPC